MDQITTENYTLIAATSTRTGYLPICTCQDSKNKNSDAVQTEGVLCQHTPINRNTKIINVTEEDTFSSAANAIMLNTSPTKDTNAISAVQFNETTQHVTYT